ncbi:MAG: ABC transporter permease [Candidatus Sulfopaludibacter sp.]|nr:ABC transporter permease [Candidatus Sulfopaludibacter sp.]
MLRSRGFLVTAILVLGIGLGFNLILFNTAYALLWRPLHFPQPDRLVTLSGRSESGDLSSEITGRDAWIIRSEAAVVSGIGLTGRRRLISLFQGDEGIDMPSAAVDSDYFRVLGLRPVAGRLFGAEEDLGASPEQPAVLTESAWRTHFGSDLSVVGRVFVLQEGGKRRQARVIGVVSGMATLPFASDAEILRPIASASPGVRMNAGDALYRCVVRLQPGMSHRQASTRIDAALRATSSESQPGAWGHHWWEPLRTAVAPVKHTTIWLLYGAACLLLLLTCANLASLFVARSIARTHETSVHLALGATRRRVVGANFRDALLVCAAGTVLAFLIESWVRPLVPKFIPAVKNAGPELLAAGPVLLAFGVAICLVVSLLVSAASGLRFQIDGLAGALAQGGRGGGCSGAGRSRVILAAGQVAIVLPLLTVAGMIGRSFLSAVRSNPGLDAQGIVTVQLSLPGSQGAPLPAISNLVARIATMPGVTRVSYSAELPVGSPAFSTVTAARGGELRSTDPMIAYRLIGPSYFETLGGHMLAGRTFSQAEVQEGGAAVILNEAAARLLFPGGPAIGGTVHSGIGDRKSSVVGVVKNIRTEGLDQAAVPMVYMPYFSGWGLRFIIRSGRAPGTLLPLLRDRVRSANPGALLQQYRPLDEVLDETVRGRMLAGSLVGGFALLGLVISSVGLYGTLAAQVQRRRREIGIRIAMGATVHNVVATILGDGLRIMAFGTLAGTAGSLAAGWAIQRELYGVSPRDLASFAAALALLSIAALTACLIPAFQAGQVDPIQALNVQ